MHSTLSVEVPSSASQRIVLSSSSASKFLELLLSWPCSAGQGYCSRYPGDTTGIGLQSSGARVFIARCGRFCAMQARFEFDVASSENLVVVFQACMDCSRWLPLRPTLSPPQRVISHITKLRNTAFIANTDTLTTRSTSLAQGSPFLLRTRRS